MVTGWTFVVALSLNRLKSEPSAPATVEEYITGGVFKSYLKQDSKTDSKEGGDKDTALINTTAYCEAVRLETVVLNNGLHPNVKGCYELQ